MILGEPLARWTVIGMLLAQFALLFYLVASGYFHWVILVALAAAPSLKRVFQVYGSPRPSEPPEDLPQGVWPLYLVAAATPCRGGCGASSDAFLASSSLATAP